MTGLYPAFIDPDLTRAQQSVNKTSRHSLQSGKQKIVYSLTVLVFSNLYIPDSWSLQSFVVRLSGSLIQSLNRCNLEVFWLFHPTWQHDFAAEACNLLAVGKI